MEPNDLALPYGSWVPGQERLIRELACLDDKYILCEAPTGTGKSAVAVGVGRLVGDHTVFLTATKLLQEQYRVAFHPDLVVATGRSNWTCNEDPTVDAGSAACTGGVKCSLQNTQGCDYYRQKLDALDHPEAVLNYQYWLACANYTEGFTGADLLVCDEAHAVEDEVRRFATVTITRGTFKVLGLPWPGDLPLRGWLAYASRFRASARRLQDELREAPEGPVKQRRVRALNTLSRNLASLEYGLDDNWVMEEPGWGVQFRPVWVAPLMDRLVYAHAKRVLFLSATILDKDLFCQQLGLPAGETGYVRAPSSFPKESRPLWYWPVGKVKTTDTEVLDKLVARVDQILDEHPGERGLVHTVSYKLADYLVDKSRHQGRMLIHDTKSKGQALETYKADAGRVLVSPSVGTGVDLPYDLCRFQVVAKLPFPDLGDKQIKKRMRVGPDGQPNPKGQGWYNWSTACSLVQAYGRGMRAVDDSCVTYLLDGNWTWFRHTVREMLPGWFKEAIKTRREPGSTVTLEDLFKEFGETA